MKVYVCAVSEKIPDLVSWQIMRRTRFQASHCLIIKGNDVFEAGSEGVRRTPVFPYLVDHMIVEKIELEAPCTDEEFEQWFSKLNGVPYSVFQWWGFILPVWTHRLFKNGRKAAICTEFVCWFLTDMMGWVVSDEEFKRPEEVIKFVKEKVGG